jgi:hypothetical protein
VETEPRMHEGATRIVLGALTQAPLRTAVGRNGASSKES